MITISETLMHVLCLHIFNESVGSASEEYRSVNVEAIDYSTYKDGFITISGFLSFQAKGDSYKLEVVPFKKEIPTTHKSNL